MPRSERSVAPDVEYDITECETDRQIVFHCSADRLTYLRLLREQDALRLPMLAHGVTSNHIHLMAAPIKADSLSPVMQRMHGRYAL